MLSFKRHRLLLAALVPVYCFSRVVVKTQLPKTPQWRLLPIFPSHSLTAGLSG